ncbi:MAG: ABC transporter substrate-binding protein, partial [Candidatus Rokuibacteriota bacterium]
MPLTRAVLVMAMAALALGAAGPAVAQTFVFGAQGEPVQFDPAVITDGISAKITRQVFDTLYQFKAGSTEVEPALAEKA